MVTYNKNPQMKSEYKSPKLKFHKISKQKTLLVIFTLVSNIFKSQLQVFFIPKLRWYHTNFQHTIVCLFKVTCFPLNYCKNKNLFLLEQTTTQCRSFFFYLKVKLFFIERSFNTKNGCTNSQKSCHKSVKKFIFFSSFHCRLKHD